LRFKKMGLAFLFTTIVKAKRITAAGFVIAIWLTTPIPEVAQNTATRESNIGVVGGMVEDVNGAIIHEAELTIKCPLPCGAQTIVASDSGGFEFSNLTLSPDYSEPAGIQGMDIVHDAAHSGSAGHFVN
jgi:hypothetical protein